MNGLEAQLKLNLPIAEADYQDQNFLFHSWLYCIFAKIFSTLDRGHFLICKMFPYIIGCNWLATALLMLVACISLLSIFSQLWSLGFYICSSSKGFNLLESDYELVKPLLKNVTIETSTFYNGNSSTQSKLTQKTENMERQKLVDYDLNNKEKSKGAQTVGNKILGLEPLIIKLGKLLEFEKEKSAQDQIMFLRTLSDLQSYHGNKLSNLEVKIAELQQELQAEKIRMSEQAHLIETLTSSSSEAINCAEILQNKLFYIETKVNKSKEPHEKDLPEPQASGLEDAESKRTKMMPLSEYQLQKECDCLKADLLGTKQELEQVLHEDRSFFYETEVCLRIVDI